MSKSIAHIKEETMTFLLNHDKMVGTTNRNGAAMLATSDARHRKDKFQCTEIVHHPYFQINRFAAPLLLVRDGLMVFHPGDLSCPSEGSCHA